MKNNGEFITSYEDPENYSSKKTIKRYRGALVVVSIIGLGLMFTLGFQAYQVSKIDPFEKPGSTLAQDYFLESAKTYFDFDPTKLPTTSGSCSTVALKTIQEEKLISDINYYNKCDKNVSLVKACKLESGNYHFEVNMACGGNTSSVAYGEEKLLTDDSAIANKTGAKVFFSYQAEKLNTSTSTTGEKQIMWKDEITFENYKIVKESTYYRYKDKTWRFSGDVRYYYPQDKSNTQLVEEYYNESPNENYKFKEVSQNYAYKWYIQNDNGPRYYYPSGSTDSQTETTYYLTAPVKGAKRDDGTKTYAAKYYRVTNTTASDYLPGEPSHNAIKLGNTETWSAWSPYTQHLPEVSPFGKGNREIETRVKVEVVPINPVDNNEIKWDRITDSYISEQDLINELQKMGYPVKNMEDVLGLSDVKYQLRQTYKEPKKA